MKEFYTKQQAIEEVKELKRQLNDKRYKNWFLKQQRVKELVERHNITFEDLHPT